VQTPAAPRGLADRTWRAVVGERWTVEDEGRVAKDEGRSCAMPNSSPQVRASIRVVAVDGGRIQAIQMGNAYTKVKATGRPASVDGGR
jgi:hypothetical protein